MSTSVPIGYRAVLDRHFGYRLEYSSEEDLYVATVAELPTMSFPAADPRAALDALLGEIAVLSDDDLLPSRLIARHRDAILDICEKHGASDVRVFGPAARGEDTVGSALDLLVKFAGGVSLSDHVGMQSDLEDLLGIRVRVAGEDSVTGQRETELGQAVPL